MSGFVFLSLPADGRANWPMIGHDVGPLRAGALEGWPAGSGVMVQAGVSTLALGVSGGAPSQDLRRMAESARPAQPGLYLPPQALTWQAWAALVVAATITVGALLRLRVLRQSEADLGGDFRPLRPLRAPMLGLVLILGGASLSWRQLYSSGDDFRLLGWQDPLAVVVVALSLLAVAAAAASLTSRRRVRVWPLLLGLFALFGLLLSAVYAPPKARFMTDYFELFGGSMSTGIDAQLLDAAPALGVYLRGSAVPAPGPGFYLALLGICLIIWGAAQLSSRRGRGDSAGRPATLPAQEPATTK